MNQEAVTPVDEAVAELASRQRFQPYPAYQDSGVAWLAELPAHWTAKRLKHLCLRSALYGANEPASSYVDDGVRFLRTTDISEQGDLVGEGVHLEPEVVRDYVLASGDLLISRSGTIGRAFVFDTTRHGPCAYAGYLVRFVPGPTLFPRFAFYFTKSKIFEHWLSLSVISSTIGNVNGQKYANMQLAHPPLDEQRAIAAFLDRETVRIDGLIAKKQRLIELLAEKRTALISHGVTKGLNPDTPMKDSGIDWLGQVPEHWRVKRLKFLADGGLENGLFKKKQFFGSGVRLVNVFDVYRDDFAVDETTLERVEADSLETHRYAVRPGDIFFVRSSLKLEGVGKSACMLELSEPAVFECHLVRMRPSLNAILPHFLINFLNSIPATNRLIALANQVTMTTIDQDKFKRLEVPVPPLQEQEAITERLSEHTRTFFALTSSVREAIDKLREYRSALISAVVTGKIDVREEPV